MVRIKIIVSLIREMCIVNFKGMVRVVVKFRLCSRLWLGLGLKLGSVNVSWFRFRYRLGKD